MQWAPYTVLVDNPDGTVNITGYYGDIWDYLQQMLGFTWVPLTVNAKTKGEQISANIRYDAYSSSEVIQWLQLSLWVGVSGSCRPLLVLSIEIISDIFDVEENPHHRIVVRQNDIVLYRSMVIHSCTRTWLFLKQRSLAAVWIEEWYYNNDLFVVNISVIALFSAQPEAKQWII